MSQAASEATSVELCSAKLNAGLTRSHDCGDGSVVDFNVRSGEDGSHKLDRLVSTFKIMSRIIGRV